MRQIDWKMTVADLGPRLFRYFAASGDPALAEDLAQETLIRLVRKIETGAYSQDRASLRTFAFGIARFVRLERWKASVQQGFVTNYGQELEAISEHPGSEELIAEHQMKARLRYAISQLKQEEQEVILLMIDDELTMKQIASIMGLSENTVKSHVRRAKENLRQQMATC